MAKNVWQNFDWNKWDGSKNALLNHVQGNGVPTKDGDGIDWNAVGGATMGGGDPTEGGSPTTLGGSSLLSSIGQGVGNAVGNLGTSLANGLSNPMLIPALTSAATQWGQANHWSDLGNEWANRANPMGDRSPYVDELKKFTTDPNSYMAQDPGYNFRMQQGLAAIKGGDSASGRMGFDAGGNMGGGMGKDLIDYSSGQASQEYNNTMNRLSNLAGANFNPAAAAQIAMQGNTNSVNSQNAALDAMFYPFTQGQQGQQQAPVTINNNNNGSANAQGGSGGTAGTGPGSMGASYGPGALGGGLASMGSPLVGGASNWFAQNGINPAGMDPSSAGAFNMPYGETMMNYNGGNMSPVSQNIWDEMNTPSNSGAYYGGPTNLSNTGSGPWDSFFNNGGAVDPGQFSLGDLFPLGASGGVGAKALQTPYTAGMGMQRQVRSF